MNLREIQSHLANQVTLFFIVLLELWDSTLVVWEWSYGKKKDESKVLDKHLTTYSLSLT